ncbi:MAG: hypothetical protein IJF07_08935 [Lachnospiraceae bacterium]|nr:hypothetical protein [Lachnospiraceae bacterium]
MAKGKNCHAYLTVYLALTMTVILSLCLALIEGVRSNAIRMEAECVMDIGLNSILAEYHRELFGQYNLLAIDSSYGTFRSGSGNVERHLYGYLERNVSMEDIFLEEVLYRDFLAMSIEAVDVTKVSILTDNSGAVFRKRAVEAIKDDVGIALMEEIAEWTQIVEDNQLLERDISKEKDELDEKLEEYNGQKVAISEKEWITIEIENPTLDLEDFWKSGNLIFLVEEPGKLSPRKLSLEGLVETRMNQGEVSAGNYPLQTMSKEEQSLEQFFFQEYLLKYMGRYGCVDENNAWSYQIEYLLVGEDSDLVNLITVANVICGLRGVANIIYLYSDEEKCLEAEILATALATLFQVPEAGELLKHILLYGWAYAESMYDVRVLLGGGRVPIIKDYESWYFDLQRALDLNFEKQEEAVGLCYEDYLRILMVTTDLDILTRRAMNMVEADIRLTEGNAAFRLDSCYDCVEASVKIGSAYGYQYEITRQKKYE